MIRAEFDPADRPTEFTDMTTVEGVVPLAGDTDNQLPALAMDAVKLNGDPVLFKFSDCELGVGPPAVAVNVRWLVLRVSAAFAETVKDTGIWMVFAAPVLAKESVPE